MKKVWINPSRQPSLDDITDAAVAQVEKLRTLYMQQNPHLSEAIAYHLMIQEKMINMAIINLKSQMK